MLHRALALVLFLTSTAAAAPPPGAVEHFEKHVRPVLVEHCYRCHGPKRQQAGLRLDSKADFLKGSDNGPVFDPRAPEKSSFLRVLAHEGDVKMPPKGKLPSDVLEPLTAWVMSGAPWPDSSAPSTTTGIRPAEVRKSHWSFRPVTRPAVPAVKDGTWPAGDLDRFVLAWLEEKGLAPSPEADRRTLLRRLSFDLIGLPPTPEELAAFEADPSPDAYAKQVDRLLSSPQYGERWGRHWLDVARYADTRGYVFMAERRFAY